MPSFHSGEWKFLLTVGDEAAMVVGDKNDEKPMDSPLSSNSGMQNANVTA